MHHVSSSLREIKDQSGILQELKHSINHTNVLGIFLHGENEMITTMITELDYTTNGILATLHSEDLHGYPVDRTKVYLSEIKSVIHFNTRFNDPVYVQIRERKQRSVVTSLN